jgi:isopentenyl phosphate kinase
MESKVRQMLNLVAENQGVEVLIFSGERPGFLLKALSGKGNGTRITNT